MLKRTNDFQCLLNFIYGRITPEGETVTESAMVFDKNSKNLREIDVLIEHKHKLSSHTIKIAVEYW